MKYAKENRLKQELNDGTIFFHVVSSMEKENPLELTSSSMHGKRIEVVMVGIIYKAYVDCEWT